MKVNLQSRLLPILLLLSFTAFAQQDLTLTKYHNEQELTANRSITLSPGFTIAEGSSVSIYVSSSPGMNIGTKLKPEMNAIVTYTPRLPGIVNAADSANGVNQVAVEVQTLDHFGRVKEIQQVKSTSLYNDLVQQKQYDGAEHEAVKYLPFVQQRANPNFYMMGYSEGTLGFYSGLDASYASPYTDMPYSEAKYEDSPLELVRSTSSPGEDFAMYTGRTVRVIPVGGFGDIIRYKASGGSLLRDGTGPHFDRYYPNRLSAVRTEDENVPAHNEDYGLIFTPPPSMTDGSSFEFKDYDGKMILKRHLREVDDVDYDFEYQSTYYVYDERGNLTFVLPPKAGADVATPTQAIIDNLCYQYKYDNQQRMIAKKLPGKGWEYMVYNKLDQVVMSQDSVQRGKASQEWNIVKYDQQGRPAISGIYVQSGSTPGTNYRATMQTNVYNQGIDWETRTTTGNGYTANTYPKTGYTPLSMNYYDDYDLPGGNPYPYSGTEVSNQTRGMATASQTNVLGTTDMLWTVSYYDGEGRNVKTYKQHYKGGTLNAGNYDEISTTYDFTGAVLTATRSHKVSGTEQVKILNEYTYDHRGRKIDSYETINTGTRTLIARNQYDELGNLYAKKLHSTNGGSTFLQTIYYAYNERGWLTRAQADKFDLNLRYSIPAHGAKAQYNGNIAEQEYTGTNSGNKYFKYNYDSYNRLIKSAYSTTGTNNISEKLAYDANGNLTTLIRGDTTNTPITYNYANSSNSNQLTSTTGTSAGSYTYDGNGNALTDSRRGATLTYNQLNLPLAVSGTNTASYLYDASGTKLKSVQTASSTTTTREYIAGIQYTNGNIDFIQTDEGLAIRNAGTGAYKYQYNLKDNLGNTRVTIDDNGSGVAEVVQEDEYYAFGLDVPKYRLTTENKYLYNGKEKQEALTDEYDYGARFYDPVIGRWTSVDPLAEFNRKNSPFTYGSNNPISRIDPDGMFDQYYDTSGGYLGQDEKGKNGVKNVVTDKGSLGKFNNKTKKDKEIVNSKDIKSELSSSNSELGASKDVFDRTIANGGKQEETTIIENGKVRIGTPGPTEHSVVEGQEVATAAIDLPYKSGGTFIHSHLTETPDDGTNVKYSTTKMGPKDPGLFSHFSRNIIMGNLEPPGLDVGDTGRSRKVLKPAQGGTFYNTSSGIPLNLTIDAIKNIINHD